MRVHSRRTFLLSLSSARLLSAARREMLVLVDLGGMEASPAFIDAIHREGYAGFIQDASASAVGSDSKPHAVRVPLPRFEDSMDDAAKELTTLTEAALKRGAQALIAIHPGLSGNGAFRPMDLERKARMLDIAGGICAKRGLSFLYENQALEFTGNAAEERALIARTDSKAVGYLLDVVTAGASGADPAAFLEVNAKRIAAIRVRESSEVIAAAAKRSKWSGWIIAPGGSDDFVRESREKIRQAFGNYTHQ